MPALQPTAQTVPDFLAAIPDVAKRADSKTLVKMMTRVTRKKPKMWGSIVGFGRYHYKYESGHEGDTCLTGFSPRKAEFSIYLMGGAFPETREKHEALLKKLGKHRMGKGCLYVKRLSDVDTAVLEDLVKLTTDTLRSHYPSA